MKKKNLVRTKQLYNTEFDILCSAAAIIHNLFLWSEDPDNILHYSDMENDLVELLQTLDDNKGKIVERVPIKKGEE